MNTVSYTEARSNFAETMKKVCHDHAPIIITRQNAESVVMMSLEDYQSISETAYLFRSPKNASRLSAAIAEIEAGGGIEKDLSDEDKEGGFAGKHF